MNRLHEKGSAQLKYSLISNALCPVLDIDDATALKAVFRQNMLHNFVIPMCIHTDILKNVQSTSSDRLPIRLSFYRW